MGKINVVSGVGDYELLGMYNLKEDVFNDYCVIKNREQKEINGWNLQKNEYVEIHISDNKEEIIKQCYISKRGEIIKCQ